MSTHSGSNDNRELLKQALREIRSLRSRLDAIEYARTEPIAVVGVGCRMPGGGDGSDAYWRLLRDGVDAVRRVPDARWSGGPIDAAEVEALGEIHGAFLDDIDAFDAAFFSISSREAVCMDPQQRILLEVAWEALESAGETRARVAGSKTGVFVGLHSQSSDYFWLQVGGGSESDVYTATGTAHSVVAGRLSYFLDARGPSVVVDTACSSSLVAAHLACQSLRTRESDLALAAGVNVRLTHHFLVAAGKMGAGSRSGRCRPFDDGADGIVFGEGCGVVVLKRLSDALASGDTIWAVIRGSAVNQDGCSAGLTAPNALAQQAVLREALRGAGVTPARIGYVEAHGTGTPLGDPIEMEALKAVVGGPRTSGLPCAVGAVKSNLGHLEGAAGIAGLIKVVLALKHAALPPNLHFERLNGHISFEGTPFFIPRELTPWPADGEARCAGVSSFGWSGTNAHLILEEAPSRAPEDDVAEKAMSLNGGPWFLPLSGHRPEALEALARAFRDALRAEEAAEKLPLRDLSYTASHRRTHHEHRLVVVGNSHEELAERLDAFTRGEARPGIAAGRVAAGRRRKVVFVFPGQGAQWAGMGCSLMDREPVFREAIERCAASFEPHVTWSLLDELRALPDVSRLDRVDVVQPVLFAMAVALSALWRSWGVEPDAVVGQSMGEIAGACVAGAMSLDDAARVVCLRSRLLRRIAGQGAMGLTELSFAEAADAVAPYAGRLSVAVSSSPRSTVLAGDPAALDALLASLRQREVFCRSIKVDYASHSAHVDPIREDLLRDLSGIVPRDAAIPVYSTVLDAVATGRELDAAYWVRNLRDPVLFSSSIQRLRAEGHDTFIEISPHPVVVTALEDNLRGAGEVSLILSSTHREQEERATLLEMLGKLHATGYPVDFRRLAPSGRCISLPAYPWQRERFWVPRSGTEGDATEQVHARTPASNTDRRSGTTESRTFDAWLLRLEWVRALPPPAPQPPPRPGSWMVFAAEGGLGREILDHLVRLGERPVLVVPGERFEVLDGAHGQCFSVRSEEPGDYRRLIDVALPEGAPPCRGVVHLWSASLPSLLAAQEDSGQDAPAAAERFGCLSVLHLVQALSRAELRDPPRLAIVTRGAQSVEVGEGCSVEAAPLWGLGRVIAHEHAEFGCLRIDLGTQETPGEADALLGEFFGAGREDQIALRKEGRSVARLARRASSAPAWFKEPRAGTGPFRGDATYLITGGLGGIGLRVAQWMVQQGVRHLVLVGRSAPSPAAEEALASMRHEGAEVVIERADVAYRDQLAAVFTRFRAAMPPLAGVFHAAAVLDDGILLQLDGERLRRVMAPKVDGAWNLHTLTAGEQLDLFVLFSSAASLLGSPGQANYSAANAFLDALAHHRRAQGLPGLSINWGPWAEIGLAAAHTARGERLSYRGVGSVTPEQGIQVLSGLLASPLAQVGVLPLNLRQWRQYYPKAASWPVFERLGAEAGGQAVGTLPNTLLVTLAAAPARERVSLLEAHLQTQIAQVLRVPSERIERETPLSTLGFDSLMGVELRNRIEASLGVTLPATIIWKFPTVAALGAHLAGKLTPEDATPPDARHEIAQTSAPAHPVGNPSVEALMTSVQALSEDDALTLLLGGP
ncbi:type I polyketide synthase [Chondromyces apiculatus]|nr:type I polyketide synthase [Chondromyces apiculatus]